ncbi:hypothetical protein LINPERPRIM_LOCUS209, partial [Linum perenne]
FTWTNKHDIDPINHRLDRALVNEDWYSVFPHFKVNIIPPALSDHCGSLVTLDSTICSFPKPFKFFDFWTAHNDFLDCVRSCWSSHTPGTPMLRLFRKQRNLKVHLKDFNKLHFGNVSQRVKAASDKLAGRGGVIEVEGADQG